MEPDLKDELARVRAREKRYKDEAEAKISQLQEEHASFKQKLYQAETERAALHALLKTQMARYHDLETKNSRLHQENESLQSRLNTAEEAEAGLRVEQVELAWSIHRRDELEQENTQLKDQVQSVLSIQYDLEKELAQLRQRNSEQDSMARCYAELLQKYPQLESLMKTAQRHSLVQCLSGLFSAGKH